MHKSTMRWLAAVIATSELLLWNVSPAIASHEACNRAMSLMQQSNYKAAIDVCNEAIKGSDPCEYSYGNRAYCYMSVGEYKRALEDANKSLELNPLLGYVQHTKALALWGMGDFARSMDSANRAIECEPKNGMFYVGRALVEWDAGKLDRALADCDKALSLCQLSSAYSSRSIVKRMMGQIDEALVDANKAVAKSKDLPGIMPLHYGNRSLLYAMKGDAVAARQDEAKVLGLSTPYRFYSTLALLYCAWGEALLGDLAKADELISQAAAQMPEYGAERARVLAVRALVEAKKGQWREAETDRLEALKIMPFSGEFSRITPVIDQLIAQSPEAAQAVAMARQSNTGASVPAAAQAPAAAASGAPVRPPQAVTAPKSNKPIQDKWALIVGISKFKNPSYNLKYAAKDARDFADYLIKEGNFAPDHVKVLLDENATREAIMSAFGDKYLPRVSMPGDLVVIYVSTHGTPSSRDKGGENYIVAYDTDRDNLYATGIEMEDLNKRIKRSVHTDRALIIMDTCYSGGATASAKGGELPANFDAASIAQGTGHLVICSSDKEERSWESNNYPNGIFTHWLLQALRQEAGKTDVKKAFSVVQEKVKWEVQRDHGASQQPQLAGVWEGGELILSTKPSAPRNLNGN